MYQSLSDHSLLWPHQDQKKGEAVHSRDTLKGLARWGGVSALRSYRAGGRAETAAPPRKGANKLISDPAEFIRLPQRGPISTNDSNDDWWPVIIIGDWCTENVYLGMKLSTKSSQYLWGISSSLQLKRKRQRQVRSGSKSHSLDLKSAWSLQNTTSESFLNSSEST